MGDQEGRISNLEELDFLATPSKGRCEASVSLSLHLILFFANLKIFVFFLIIWVCLCWVYAHDCMCPWRPAEGFSSPGDGVTGSFESPNLGAGDSSAKTMSALHH